ncbi:MAG: DNA polymerase thumb domain-containing protein, partial [Candidatus Gallimonas sp.]
MRTILHSDLNHFYASAECLKDPSLRARPVVVIGAKEARHGVVLAKNPIAKQAGVQTGDVYWEARQKCGKSLVEITADFLYYLRLSKEVRKIYEEYTDRIESYGIDECWLDVTESLNLFGDGVTIAEKIRERVKREIGLTVSVGVSWNKIFAKLGSDMKKPDAVTEITPENYRTVVWRLPVGDLLYVGKATERKLNRAGIRTIGDLAQANEERLVGMLGKWGRYLYAFANGKDGSPVVATEEEETVKSIGNSLTVYRDLRNEEDVRMVLRLLGDSVASRVRESGLRKAATVRVTARANDLTVYAKRGKMPRPSAHACDVASAAFALFRAVYPWDKPVRSLGITVSDFQFGAEQLELFGDEREEKLDRLDETVDRLRKKYGRKIIRSAIVCKDPKIGDLDVQGEHVIHPYSFFRR